MCSSERKLWIMTERTRPRIQAAEIGFLCRVAVHIGCGACSRAAAPSHQDEPAEVAWEDQGHIIHYVLWDPSGRAEACVW